MIDRATFTWGRFIQGKIDETKEVPVKNDKRPPMQRVPKYAVEEIEYMLDGTKPAVAAPIDISDPFSIQIEEDRYRPRGTYQVPVGERSI